MWLKKILVLLSCICLTCQISTAQSVLKGIVRDEKDIPLPYATLSLEKSDAEAPVMRQADSLGHFAFNQLVNGEYQLSVYALGYDKKKLSVYISRDTLITVSLHPLSGSLNEVVVTGNKPVIERKADRVIYNVANSIQAAGSNGLEVLGKVPGIKIDGNTVSLAGKGDLGILVNGRTVHLSDKALGNYLKSFSSGQIEKIEVITNPSVQYTAEGNAGLINIITKRSISEGLSGEVNGSVTRFIYTNQPDYKGIKNYGDLNGSLGLNYNKGRWSLYSNINYTAGRELWGYGIDVYYPDKHWAMKDTGEYRVSTVNWISGVDYRPGDKTTLGFEYMYGRHLEEGADYVRIPVYSNTGQLDSTIKTYATYYPIAVSNSFNLHLIQSLGSAGASLTLNADYFNFYRHDRSDLITQSYSGTGKLEEDKTLQLYDTALQNIRIYTFKADADIPTSFARFSLGTKLSFINNYSDIFYYNKENGALILDQDLSNVFRYIENTQAVYLNGAKEAGKWKLDAGLRAELTQTQAIAYFQDQQVNRHYLKLFPSLLASYNLNDKNSFSLSYNKRIHRPTFWNLNPYKTFMTAYTYVEGNPYLEPEYVTNAEVAHNYKNMLTSSFYINVINNGFAQVTRTNDTGYYIHTTAMLNFFRAFRYGISESFSIQPFPWMETSNQVNAYYTTVHTSVPYIDGVSGPGLYVSTNNTFFFNRAKTIRGAVNFWYQFREVDRFGKSDPYYNLNIGFQVLALQKRLTLSLQGTDLLESSGSVLHTTVKGIKNTFTNFQIYRNIQLSASWQFGKSTGKRSPASTGNEAERSRVN